MSPNKGNGFTDSKAQTQDNNPKNNQNIKAVPGKTKVDKSK